jgi:hypothetical protein
MTLEGTLTGNLLQGRIVFPNHTFTWPTYGYVEADHVRISALNASWDLRRQ